MLQSLHVHNFALLEDAHADFTPGFNVFTGETGAGKSILIDAFGMVLGGRSSADYVRSGTDGLWVQAVFDVSGQQELKALLAEHGLEPEEDLFLKRQISAAGKSRAFINGVQVPLAVLKAIGARLVDIHGQHENQALLKPDAPLHLTDAFGGPKLAQALQEYKQLYSEYTAAVKHLSKLEQENEQQDLLLDRYAWEIKEISDAALKPGEEDGLEAEARLLQNSERIMKAVDSSYQQLDEEDAILSRLARVRDQLQYAARYDSRLAPLAECADSAWISLDDCRTELSEYMAGSEFNSERAAQVQQRLDIIYRLQKKYGGSTQSALDYLQQTQEKLEQLQQIAKLLEQAQKAVAEAVVRLGRAAAVLTKLREASAQALAQRITQHIRDLAMPNGVLQIKCGQLDKFMPLGRDELKFIFSANMGEPLNDLEKVASGGELSRITLAIKNAMADKDAVPTVIYDEIDSGVSGKAAGRIGGVTAQKMAEKIAAISSVGQVLCITHLPQIAAFADNHIHIEKQSADGRTVTQLTTLDYNGRLQELVRMTAGATASRAAFESATELLQGAEQIKSSLKRTAGEMR